MSFDAFVEVSSRDADIIVGPTFLAAGLARLAVVRVPRWARFGFFEVIGCGAGGGGGCGKAGGAAGGGGGGGASGGVARAIIPAMVLGDRCYVQVASGALGGSGGSSGSGSAGGNSSRSAVLLGPVSNQQPTVIASQSGTLAGGGGGGTAAAAGAAGTPVAAVTESLAWLINLGIWVQTQSVGGAAGGAQTGAVGANVTVAKQLSGGAGGAGSTSADFAGGSVTSPPNTQIRTVSGGAAGSNPGQPGAIYLPYGYHMGGGGGGASNTTTGGAGGSGALGCGGGGGGAGVTTGGAGGRGGDGRVRIWWIR